MIIVPGGAGFIGSALVCALNDRGIDDIMIVDHLGISENIVICRRNYVENINIIQRQI